MAILFLFCKKTNRKETSYSSNFAHFFLNSPLIYEFLILSYLKKISGDSGGGLVLEVDDKWKLIGIVSSAIAKKAEVYGAMTNICDLNNYLVYTDVSKYNDWIYEVIFETILP